MKTLNRVIRFSLFVCVLLFAASVARAQCVPSPTRDTAVSVMNASHYVITVYVDGINSGRLPPGERTIDFVIAPGEHRLTAETTINGESVSATRSLTVTAGSVCVWTVTDPLKPREQSSKPYRDNLIRVAVITLAIAN